MTAVLSQKSMSIAFSIVAFMPSEMGSGGLMSLACLIAHVTQVSLIVIVKSRRVTHF